MVRVRCHAKNALNTSRTNYKDEGTDAFMAAEILRIFLGHHPLPTFQGQSLSPFPDDEDRYYHRNVGKQTLLIGREDFINLVRFSVLRLKESSIVQIKYKYEYKTRSVQRTSIHILVKRHSFGPLKDALQILKTRKKIFYIITSEMMLHIKSTTKR